MTTRPTPIAHLTRLTAGGLAGLLLSLSLVVPAPAPALAAGDEGDRSLPAIQLLGLDATYGYSRGVVTPVAAAPVTLAEPVGGLSGPGLDDRLALDAVPAVVTLPIGTLAEGNVTDYLTARGEGGTLEQVVQSYTVGVAATGGKIIHLIGLRGEPFEQVVGRYSGSRWLFFDDGTFALLPADGGPRLSGYWEHKKKQQVIDITAGTAVGVEGGRYVALMKGRLDLRNSTARVLHRTALSANGQDLSSAAEFSIIIN